MVRPWWFVVGLMDEVRCGSHEPGTAKRNLNVQPLKDDGAAILFEPARPRPRAMPMARLHLPEQVQVAPAHR